MLTDIVIRNFVFERVADFDIITEHFVVSDFESSDTRFFFFLRFDLFNYIAGMIAHLTQSVKFFIEPVAYVISVFTVRRRVGVYRALNKFGNIRKIVDIIRYILHDFDCGAEQKNLDIR